MHTTICGFYLLIHAKNSAREMCALCMPKICIYLPACMSACLHSSRVSHVGSTGNESIPQLFPQQHVLVTLTCVY